MTWKETKDKIESLGVLDTDKVNLIDIWDSSESDSKTTMQFSCNLDNVIAVKEENGWSIEND